MFSEIILKKTRIFFAVSDLEYLMKSLPHKSWLSFNDLRSKVY